MPEKTMGFVPRINRLDYEKAEANVKTALNVWLESFLCQETGVFYHHPIASHIKRQL